MRRRGAWVEPVASRLVALIVLASAAAAVPGALSAQTIVGRLVEAESGRPVAGALVMLFDRDGRRVAGSLTGEAGAFELDGLADGVYSLRAERIGLETLVREGLVVGEGRPLRLELAMTPQPIEVAGLDVSGAGRCTVRPGQGLVVAELWDEARKALRNQDWTAGERRWRFRVSRWERELERDARVVLGETRQPAVWTTGSPIGSLGAEDLVDGGFVRPTEDGGYTFYGPDAAVLLSDAFLDTHCFRLTEEDAEPGAVGLAFEPVGAGGGETADVSGTLWLDRETARPLFLEFGYTWSPWRQARGVARGRVDFEELPGGAWIVRRWWIRMPRMAADLGLSRSGVGGLRVAGLVEAGGEVLDAEPVDRVVRLRSGAGRLTGVVWDSAAARPLAGAEVFLAGGSDVARTDTAGRFTLDAVPPGSYAVGFRHPRLDSLGVDAVAVEAAVRPGRATEVRLAAPAVASALLSICPGVDPRAGEGAVVGRVRGAAGSLVAGAAVHVEWTDYEVVAGREILGDVRGVDVVTDAGGRFRACGLPPGVRVEARAVAGAAEGPVRRAVVRRAGIVVLDLRMPPDDP